MGHHTYILQTNTTYQPTSQQSNSNQQITAKHVKKLYATIFTCWIGVFNHFHIPRSQKALVVARFKIILIIMMMMIMSIIMSIKIKIISMIMIIIIFADEWGEGGGEGEAVQQQRTRQRCRVYYHK